MHILELLEDNDNYYFVMELMPYGNLLEVLKKSNQHGWKLKDKEAAKLIK